MEFLFLLTFLVYYPIFGTIGILFDKVFSQKSFLIKLTIVAIFTVSAWYINGLFKHGDSSELTFIIFSLPSAAIPLYLSIVYIFSYKKIIANPFIKIILYCITCGIIFLVHEAIGINQQVQQKHQNIQEYYQIIDGYKSNPEKAKTENCFINEIDYSDGANILTFYVKFETGESNMNSYSNRSHWHILSSDVVKNAGLNPEDNYGLYDYFKKSDNRFIDADGYTKSSYPIFDISHENPLNAQCFKLPNLPELSNVIIKDVFLKEGEKINFMDWLKGEIKTKAEIYTPVVENPTDKVSQTEQSTISEN